MTSDQSPFKGTIFSIRVCTTISLRSHIKASPLAECNPPKRAHLCYNLPPCDEEFKSNVKAIKVFSLSLSLSLLFDAIPVQEDDVGVSQVAKVNDV